MLTSGHYAIIRQVAKRYIARDDDDWYLEDILVELARRGPFNVADEPSGNPRIPLRGFYEGYSVAGTGSPTWNEFISKFGTELRASEGVFRRAKYDDVGNMNRLVESIGKGLELHAGSL